MAETVKKPPAMKETQVRSLGREDPLEKGMATHSSNSCLDNPMDSGAWRATLLGVKTNRTQMSDFHFYFSTQRRSPHCLRSRDHTSPFCWSPPSLPFCSSHLSQLTPAPVLSCLIKHRSYFLPDHPLRLKAPKKKVLCSSTLASSSVTWCVLLIQL